MSCSRLTGFAAAIGFILPGLFIAAYRIPYTSAGMEWAASQLRLDVVLLLLAPPSAVLVADYDNTSVVLAAICVLSNALLYAFLGWLFWIGVHRSRYVLAAPTILVFGLWALVLA